MTRLDCAVTRRACAAPEGARRTNPTPTQRFRAGLNSLSRIVERDPSGKGFLGLPPFDYAQGRLLSPKAGERMGHPTPLKLSLRAPALGARNLLFVLSQSRSLASLVMTIPIVIRFSMLTTARSSRRCQESDWSGPSGRSYLPDWRRRPLHHWYQRARLPCSR